MKETTYTKVGLKDRMIVSYELFMTFRQMRSNLCNTDLWMVVGTQLKIKPDLVTFYECTYANRWTFQPTLVAGYLLRQETLNNLSIKFLIINNPVWLNNLTFSDSHFLRCNLRSLTLSCKIPVVCDIKWELNVLKMVCWPSSLNITP